jgi:ubiquinone/menaquinone biosynthesis C-methylase UbiE
VRLFERQWLTNLILWGNLARLRDAVLEEFGPTLDARTLQVACVYGDFSTRLAERLAPGGSLDVVDVLPIQLHNLRRKLDNSTSICLYQRNSAALQFGDASYDYVIIFFLLHEQPASVRRETLSEALRVLKPCGKLVVIDYHRPGKLHPLRYLMRPVLRALEPFALDLWRREVCEWLPATIELSQIRKRTFFGGLYQKLVITPQPAPAG